MTMFNPCARKLVKSWTHFQEFLISYILTKESSYWMHYWVVYKDHNSSIDELVKKDNSCKIYDQNVQKLVTEVFKLKMNLASELMREILEIVEDPIEDLFVLRNELKLKSRRIHSISYGIGTASFVGARIWNS